MDKYGEIEHLNICDNLADHMVGNVYIKFKWVCRPLDAPPLFVPLSASAGKLSILAGRCNAERCALLAAQPPRLQCTSAAPGPWAGTGAMHPSGDVKSALSCQPSWFVERGDGWNCEHASVLTVRCMLLRTGTRTRLRARCRA